MHSFHYKRVDVQCLTQPCERPLRGDHITSNFPDNGISMEKSRRKMDINNEKEPEAKKNINVYFCVA